MRNFIFYLKKKCKLSRKKVLFLSLLMNSPLCFATANFSEFLEAPRIVQLTANSKAEDLREAYQEMRQNIPHADFISRAGDFKKEIFSSVNMVDTSTQEQYIEELISLKDSIKNKSSVIIRDYFEKHVKHMSNRLDLARIDHQRYLGNGFKGGFDQNDLPVAARPILSALIGKIFHIYKNDEYKEKVKDVGSGTLTVLDGMTHLPQNLQSGAHHQLNGVITCAHVMAASDDEQTLGIYFVPHDALNPLSGLPRLRHDNANLENKKDLIAFLQNSPVSFTISDYHVKKRNAQHSVDLSQVNTSTNPQYFDNEDIVLGSISLRVNQNFRDFQDQNITVNFDSIRNNTNPVLNNGNRYFAAGYPGCDHYDLNHILNDNDTKHQHALVDKMGYSPLILSSELVKHYGQPHARPHYSDNGTILHEAPTAKGMSGGPLFFTTNDTVNFLGVITSGSGSREYGCY